MTQQINGTHKNDSSWHHVWLITNDKIVIDITGDQFIGKLVSKGEVSPIHVGSENKVHRLFCSNRVCEPNTNFTDAKQFTGFGGTPSRRQKYLKIIYAIICRYINH